MKRLNRILLFAVFGIINLNCYSQTVATPYEVGKWNGFRSAAICYTFDDNYPNQLSIAAPAFDKYDFKMTLYTITGSWDPNVNWTNLEAVASHGHEVGSHTITHPHPAAQTAIQQNTELKNSKSTIESHITGEKCITIAYPYCEKNIDTITQKYYIAARGCSGAIEPSTPASFMNISSMVCGTLGINTVETFKARFASTAANKGLCVFLIHGMDSENSYSPLSSKVLKNSLLFLSYRKSKFWVTTFRNAALYIKERNAANVTVSSDLDTVKVLSVTDALDDSIYNLPITIRRPLPIDWPSAVVTQQDISVPTRIVKVDTVVYLTFDVIPDGGDVKILKSNDIVVPEIDTIPPDSIPKFTGIKNPELNSSFNKLRVWISNDNLNFSIPPSSGLNLVVTLYDMTGRSLAFFKLKRNMDGTGNIQLPKTLVKSNGYIVNVTDGINTWSKQIMLM